MLPDIEMRFSLLVLLAIVASASARPSAPFVSLTQAFVSKAATDATPTTDEVLDNIPSGGAAAMAEMSLTVPLAQSSSLDEVADAPLVADIEMLSNMLAEVVKKENPTVYELYTRFRKHGMDRAADPNDVESIEIMKQLAHDITPRDALGVMKTFSIALNLVNAAEVNHRMRLVRLNEKASEEGMNENVGPLPMIEDSVRGTMEILLDDGVDPDKIFERLITQKCEIVLTAHPTEVNRKTIISKCEYYLIFFFLCVGLQSSVHS